MFTFIHYYTITSEVEFTVFWMSDTSYCLFKQFVEFSSDIVAQLY